MANSSFFRKLSFFFQKHKVLLKYFVISLVICYFVLLFIANIFYFKKNVSDYWIFPKVNFGIDVVGGNQLTVAIDTSDIVNESINNTKEFISTICKEKVINCIVSNETRENNKVIDIKMTFLEKNKKSVKDVIKTIRNSLHEFEVNVVKNNGRDVNIEILLSKKAISNVISEATDKAISILKNRIDGVGVKEIAIQRYGEDKIVILIPNSVNVNDIRSVINTTAKLEFRLMDKHHIFYYRPKEIAKKHELLPSYKGNEIFYIVENKSVLNGDSIASVQPSIDGINNAINFRFNSKGTKIFGDITKNNVGRLLAIILDGRVLMAPMINTAILNGTGSITGHFTPDEVVNLSVLLRSGSLPAKIEIINEKQLSSILDKAILSKISYIVIIALFLIGCLMFVRYKILGLVAILALVLNFLFTFGIISIFGLTLTLPGIAGFVLMLGMATDGNILIYEKMKDIAKVGIKYKDSVIKNGFSRAIATILDANITTIIATIALFSFGGSFIKGFSITLIFGILCSIFTSINITKMIIEFIFRKKTYISV